MTKEFDIIVIGGGPAGYVAAIRAAQLDATVCLVEAESLGGTCLNHGCIPTKTLLYNADFVRELATISKRGITVADPTVTIDIAAMMRHKDGVVKRLVLGLTSLLKSYNVEVIQGTATIEPNFDVTINGNVAARGKKIIFAGGSEAIRPPIEGIQSPKVLTNREVLKLDRLPPSLVIVGGGVIGVETARIFSAFGTAITIIELADRLIPFFDEEISKAILAQLQKDRVQVQLGTKVTRFNETAESDFGGINVETADGKTYSADYVLMSVGRKANLSAIEKLGLKTERGFVVVDDTMQSSLAGLYAPGDVNGLSMLAHSAFKMAEVAVENALGHHKELSLPKLSLHYIPQILYGNPEAASVGMTEADAAQSKRAFRVGRFSFIANGRALASEQKTGFVKVIADTQTGEILGVQMLGPSVSELINEAAALMSAGVSVHQLADTIHGHPTYSEALMEAAADALGRCLHLPKK